MRGGQQCRWEWGREEGPRQRRSELKDLEEERSGGGLRMAWGGRQRLELDSKPSKSLWGSPAQTTGFVHLSNIQCV